MPALADSLAGWTASLEPDADDLTLARRALLDTVAVAAAARDAPEGRALDPLLEPLGQAGRWAALAHVLDFDDLHLPSTTHVSAVCVPVVLACGGGARDYLAGAGAMVRLGAALGWSHYSAGWHATCTAGAPAAAVAAASALGLDAERTAAAIALAVPAAGGVQRAFGTSAKSLQVGFAADAGVRAARLAAAGASADPAALEQWLALVGGDLGASEPARGLLDPAGPAVPDGLAIKLHPCCYALQRPIAAVRALREREPALRAERVRRIRVTTPESALQPLIHHRPRTGLEGKFSLEYGVAAALLDDYPDLASFADEAVRRPEAQRLVEALEAATTPGGDGLLAGEVAIELMLDDGTVHSTSLALPPGAPARPPTEAELAAKLAACTRAAGTAEPLANLTWSTASGVLPT
ncbi:MAG TPA: MmgE/PrpD family protein [Conexibacter sp.]|nr:MmgE/PrpD family protein [Conexibacter sp.]